MIDTTLLRLANDVSATRVVLDTLMMAANNSIMQQVVAALQALMLLAGSVVAIFAAIGSKRSKR